MAFNAITKNRKCSFCGHVNSGDINVCGLCGHGLNRKQDNIIKVAIGIALLVILVVVIYNMRKVQLNFTGSAQAPRLELISSAGYHSMNGEMVVEGKVRNISGDLLRDIQAVVSWYDKQGNKVIDASSAIYLNPVLSFQVSPFRVSLPHNAKMERYDITFKSPNGEVIYTRDARGKAEG
jgi:uncharacterized integral membrane protein